MRVWYCEHSICAPNGQFAQTDESELQDWAVAMNDRFDARSDDPKYDGAAAIRDCANMFMKYHKVAVRFSPPCNGRQVEAPPPGDSDSEDDNIDDEYPYVDAYLTETVMLEPVHKAVSKEQQMISAIEREFQKLDLSQLREEGIHVMAMKENPLAWRVVMFNFPEDTPIAKGLEDYCKQFGIVSLFVSMDVSCDVERCVV